MIPQPSIQGRPPEPDDGRAGALGLFLLLVSLAVFFASVLMAVWISSARAEDFRHEHRGIPGLVWVSTALLAWLSFQLERGRRRLDRGERSAGVRDFRFALLVVIAFLAVQTWTWVVLHLRGLGATSGLYGFSFHLLTWMHALHVVGGVVFHLLTLRALAGGDSRRVQDWPRHCAVYWHFLGVTWIAILVTLAGTALDGGPDFAAVVCYWLAWGGAIGMVVCWLLTVRLLWIKDGPGWGLLGLFPLFSMVFGWVRFQEHDNLRTMIAWQLCIAVSGLSFAMWMFLS